MTREEAIKELKEDKMLYETDLCHAWDGSPDGQLLEALDMAIEALRETQKHEETFEWCHDCKEYDKDNYCCHRWTKAIRNTVEELKADRPKGEWIDYSDEGYVECPFCHSATNCDGNKDELHFCFSCGARMKGGDDE